jgi:glyoxylase-like metal-dependent hydrolase (beta-lactamase superfamily II)
MTSSDPTLHALRLHVLPVGEWQENCYLLVERTTNEGLLIDPGDEAGRILDWIAGVTVRQILLTHAHRDHVGALAEVRATLGVPAGLHPDDEPLAADYDVTADFALRDGDVVRLGAHEIRVAHAPGHTPGSICLCFDSRAIVGDVVFPGGPGHTNTPEELIQSLASLQGMVFTWPDETTLYPGHGQPTTVGQERPGFEAFLARPRPADLCGDVTWTAQ